MRTKAPRTRFSSRRGGISKQKEKIRHADYIEGE